MDTKLKKSSGIGYGILWIFTVITTVLTGISVSLWGAFYTIEWYSDAGYYEDDVFFPYETHWSGRWLEEKMPFDEVLLWSGIFMIGFFLLALIGLIALMVLCGREHKGENGTLRLNWFDRIWSELHLAIGIVSGVGFGGLVYGFMEVWACENWFGWFLPEVVDTHYAGIPNRLLLCFMTVGLVACTIVTWTCLIALVKKMKGHGFWKHSLIGGTLIWIWDKFYRLTAISPKVALYIAGLILIQIWWGYMSWWNNGFYHLGAAFIGGLLTLLWIAPVVPKLVSEFKALEKGAKAIRGGDLSYRIPITPGFRGKLDPLGQVADDLNHIGDAQKLAVENELKNQRMKADLISNVSHDLKTPLTSMTAYIDLLKKEGLDSPNAEAYLDIIEQKTHRLKSLTEDLFEAAKASSGATPVRMEEIDLSALMNQSLAEMESKLAEKNLSVLVKNHCEGCKVWADGQLLWRVIENLLGNVSKYSLEGSRVYLDMGRVKGGKILLEVKNISRDPLNISADELMERFTRGDQSRNTEGSGLGLAITRDLMHLMDGNFEIHVDGDLFKASVILSEIGGDVPVEESTEREDFATQQEVPTKRKKLVNQTKEKVSHFVKIMKEKSPF